MTSEEIRTVLAECSCDASYDNLVDQLERVGWKPDRWGHLQREIPEEIENRSGSLYVVNEARRFRIVFKPRRIRVEQRTSFGTWNRIRSIHRATATIEDFGWHGKQLSTEWE